MDLPAQLFPQADVLIYSKHRHMHFGGWGSQSHLSKLVLEDTPLTSSKSALDPLCDNEGTSRSIAAKSITKKKKKKSIFLISKSKKSMKPQLKKKKKAEILPLLEQDGRERSPRWHSKLAQVRTWTARSAGCNARGNWCWKQSPTVLRPMAAQLPELSKKFQKKQEHLLCWFSQSPPLCL